LLELKNPLNLVNQLSQIRSLGFEAIETQDIDNNGPEEGGVEQNFDLRIARIVFFENDVFVPMESLVNTPMTSNELLPALGMGFHRAEIEVGGFVSLTVASTVVLNAKNCSCTGPLF